jgi:hypothetical protein
MELIPDSLSSIKQTFIVGTEALGSGAHQFWQGIRCSIRKAYVRMSSSNVHPPLIDMVIDDSEIIRSKLFSCDTRVMTML